MGKEIWKKELREKWQGEWKEKRIKSITQKRKNERKQEEGNR